MLLHGIDRQLAQALTIPASARLCKLRAAIAVTSGYLDSLQTFTDRGILFTLDIRRDAIEPESLRNFVGRYLNAGRVPDLLGTGSGPGDPPAIVPNACLTCPDLRRCHDTFGASEDGYGFYPFNGAAIDRLVDLASPGDFQPRAVLREVIRAPLDVAEEELPSGRIPFRAVRPDPGRRAQTGPAGGAGHHPQAQPVRPGSGTEPARLLRRSRRPRRTRPWRASPVTSAPG